MDSVFSTLHLFEIIILALIVGSIIISIKILPNFIFNKVSNQIGVNKKFQEETAEALKFIKIGITKFEREYEQDCKKNEKRLQDMEYLLAKTSQGTLETLLRDDKQSDYNRLKAFRRLTAMGINGDVKIDGFKLALEHKDIWKIIDREPLDMEIINKDHYESVIKELSTIIWR